MTVTPRMVVAAILAFSTLIVLSLSVLGAQFIANQYADRQSHPTTSATPTPTPTEDPPSDTKIAEIYSNLFSVVRLSDGGTDPIIFVTVDTDDAAIIAEKVNASIVELKALSGISTVTLLFTYNKDNYNASPLVELVDSSESLENQLIIQLD